ncbi:MULTISPECIES: hypothetical protein [unclassified Ornithinimicrobium]|uniref:hypothetical protein n=1 Tax=unclassified Ornithinimicrobium TaxID=2615080 RepID=UPI003854E993
MTVRPVLGTSALADVEALLARVWRHPPGSVELDVSLLAALGRTGNYVAGAYRNGTLVGATAGFRCEPFPTTLYSHVTGVDPSTAAAGTGTALKYHQRVWCLERHITGVRWTFDPLQARNARLNVHRLAARPIHYHRDYYGQLRDGLNRQFGSDRLLVHWDLEAPEAGGTATAAPDPAAAVLSVGPSGEPVLSSTTPNRHCRVAIPRDIDILRAKDPHVARQWRDAVRMVLGDLMAEGWEIIDFADSSYVLRPPDVEPDRQAQPCTS